MEYRLDRLGLCGVGGITSEDMVLSSALLFASVPNDLLVEFKLIFAPIEKI